MTLTSNEKRAQRRQECREALVAHICKEHRPSIIEGTGRVDNDWQTNDLDSKFPQTGSACSLAPKTAMRGPSRKDTSIYWQQA
jgi:hypothetical protein